MILFNAHVCVNELLFLLTFSVNHSITTQSPLQKFFSVKVHCDCDMCITCAISNWRLENYTQSCHKQE